VRLWAPCRGAGAALKSAARALSAAPLKGPEKALRLRWSGGYHARLYRPGNAVPSKITHLPNIIDFTEGTKTRLVATMSFAVAVAVGLMVVVMVVVLSKVASQLVPAVV